GKRQLPSYSIPKRERSRSRWRTRLTSTRRSFAASAAERLSSSSAIYWAWLLMSGSFSAGTEDVLYFKAPTLRSASVSAAESSLVPRRSAGAAVVKGRLRASAFRAAVYHL